MKMSKKRTKQETDIRVHLVGAKKTKNDSDDDSVEFVESKSSIKARPSTSRDTKVSDVTNSVPATSSSTVSTGHSAELKSFLSRFNIQEVKFNSKLTKPSDVLDNLNALRSQQISVTQKIQELSVMQQRLHNDIRKATTKYNKVSNSSLAAKDDMPVEVAMETAFPAIDIRDINKIIASKSECSATKCNPNSKFWNLSHLPANFDELVAGRLLDENKDVNLDFSETVEALPSESAPFTEEVTRPNKVAQLMDILDNTSPSAKTTNDAVNATENFLWSLLYGTDLENIVYSDNMEDLVTAWLHKIQGSSSDACDPTEIILAYLDYAKSSMRTVLAGDIDEETHLRLLEFLLEIVSKQQLLHTRIGNVTSSTADNRELLDLLMCVGKVLNDGLITAILQYTNAHKQERMSLLSSGGSRSSSNDVNPIRASSSNDVNPIRASSSNDVDPIRASSSNDVDPIRASSSGVGSAKKRDLTTIDLSEDTSALSYAPETRQTVPSYAATPTDNLVDTSHDHFMYEPDSFDLDATATQEYSPTMSVAQEPSREATSPLTDTHNSSVLSVEIVENINAPKSKVITMDLTQQSDENNSNTANSVETIMLSDEEPCWDELHSDTLVAIAELHGVYVPNLTRERLVRLLVAVWKRKTRPLTSSASVSTAQSSEQSSKEQLVNYIRNDPVIREQILFYNPIKIDDLHSQLARNNIKIHKKELQEHLDSLLIFNTLGHKKPRRDR